MTVGDHRRPVRAVTAVSAVIFLVGGRYNLATVFIVGLADVGEYGRPLAHVRSNLLRWN